VREVLGIEIYTIFIVNLNVLTAIKIWLLKYENKTLLKIRVIVFQRNTDTNGLIFFLKNSKDTTILRQTTHSSQRNSSRLVSIDCTAPYLWEGGCIWVEIKSLTPCHTEHGPTRGTKTISLRRITVRNIECSCKIVETLSRFKSRLGC
jgi:hypothetical protein